MSDYISRQAAIRLYQNVCNNVQCKDCPFLIRISDTLTDCRLEKFIYDLPSADVVEVVRCKDCKHRPTSIDGATQGFDVDFAWDSLCPCQCDDGWYNWYPPDKWYCPSGERRTDAEIH